MLSVMRMMGFCAILNVALIAQLYANQETKSYDPIYTAAPQAKKAQQVALASMDKNQNITVAVGAFGTILVKEKTGDWVQQKVPTSVMLTSVQIVSDRVIWAAGHDGVLLQSQDAGQSWQRRLDGFELYAIEKPWLENRIAKIEVAIENETDEEQEEYLNDELEELGYLLSGLSIQGEVGPTKPILDILFMNEETGFAVGAYGTFIKTENAGESWQIFNDKIDNAQGFHLNQIFQSKADNLFIVGEYGTLHRSSDAGASWEALDSPYEGSFFGGGADSSGRIWVYGLRGNIYYSDDEGENFNVLPLETKYNLNHMVELEDQRIVFVGQSGLIVIYNPENDKVQTIIHASGTTFAAVQAANQTNKLFLVGRMGIQAVDLETQKETNE